MYVGFGVLRFCQKGTVLKKYVGTTKYLYNLRYIVYVNKLINDGIYK